MARARSRRAAASPSSRRTRRSGRPSSRGSRAGLGLARTGSTAHHGSGEIFLALSTARGEPLPDADLDLWHAEPTVGREGRIAHALPHDAVLELLDRHRRLGVR
jgi:hypothetical protein